MQLPRLEPTRRAAHGMVCTVDHIASGAGARMLAAGGSAADAAVAASAVLAVTTQHMCGMGGDLWALVHEGTGPPAALNGSGRAGSGVDADELRREGHSVMPFRGDVEVDSDSRLRRRMDRASRTLRPTRLGRGSSPRHHRGGSRVCTGASPRSRDSTGSRRARR